MGSVLDRRLPATGYLNHEEPAKVFADAKEAGRLNAGDDAAVAYAGAFGFLSARYDHLWRDYQRLVADIDAIREAERRINEPTYDESDAELAGQPAF